MTNTPPTPPRQGRGCADTPPARGPLPGPATPPVTHRMTQAYQPPIPRRVGWTWVDVHSGHAPDRPTGGLAAAARAGSTTVASTAMTFDVVGAGRDQGGRIERIVEGQHRLRGMPACLGGVKLVVTT